MSANKMNLSGVSALLVDSDRHAVAILIQMLRGLGLDAPTVVESGENAKLRLKNNLYDLCIIEAMLPDMNGAELIGFIRRLPAPAKFMPVIVMTSYSNLRNVKAARDAGAHLVVKKPLSPKILFDRISWAATPNRAFVEVGAYTGPDRRFKFIGPPDGQGRRKDDLPAEIGEATEPNMSQAEIDALVKPTKIMTA